MPVDVQRRPNIFVAELPLDGQRVRAVGDEARGAGVPEVVKPQVGEARPRNSRAEDARVEVRVADRPDDRSSQGSAYDRDSSLVRNGEVRFDARYYGATRDRGRVSMCYMRFPSGTRIGEARAAVLVSEFPRDAETASFRSLGDCGLLLVRSPRLSDLAPRGEVSVEFTTGADGMGYSASDVWGAIVTPGHLTDC